MSDPGTRSSRSTVLVVALVVVAVTLVGVGVMVAAGGGGDDDDPAAGVEGVVVEDAWTGPNQSVTAVYLTILNGGEEDDRLVGASADIGGTALLMGGGEDVGHASADGAGSVSLAIPPGATEIAPGGSHLMLSDLPEPLQPGRVFVLSLTFERAGVIEVPVEVLTWQEVADRAA